MTAERASEWIAVPGSRTQWANPFQLNSMFIALLPMVIVVGGRGSIAHSDWGLWLAVATVPAVIVGALILLSWRCRVEVSETEALITTRLGRVTLIRRDVAHFRTLSGCDVVTDLISLGHLNVQPDLCCIEVEMQDGSLVLLRANAGRRRRVEPVVKRLNQWLKHGQAGALGAIRAEGRRRR